MSEVRGTGACRCSVTTAMCYWQHPIVDLTLIRLLTNKVLQQWLMRCPVATIWITMITKLSLIWRCKHGRRDESLLLCIFEKPSTLLISGLWSNRSPVPVCTRLISIFRFFSGCQHFWATWPWSDKNQIPGGNMSKALEISKRRIWL